MKHLTTLLLTILVLGGCSSEDETDVNTQILAEVQLKGICKDEEVPSPFKEKDEYEFQGRFTIYERLSRGYLLPTEDEMDKRNSMLMPDVPEYETVTKDMYATVKDFTTSEETKYFAKADIPRVRIYKISKEIFQSDTWNLDGYHSYVKGEGDSVEETRHYGFVKASCTLRVLSREGTIPEELADQFNWCFNLDCVSDSIFRNKN